MLLSSCAMQNRHWLLTIQSTSMAKYQGVPWKLQAENLIPAVAKT